MHPDLAMTIYRDKERELQQQLRYRLAARERVEAAARPGPHPRRRPARPTVLTAWLTRGSRAVQVCCAPAACCATA
jgi:hypothetical protein